MNTALLAWLHAALCGGVIVFQICLIFGAPWGRLTQGGRVDGPLPGLGRLFAGVSVVCLGLIAAVFQSLAGLGPAFPLWSAYTALSFMALGVLANIVTPSRAERRLWAPVTICLFALECAILLGGG